ncbi:MAG TPA: class D beta-lactamase [Cytophagaceae bacterium]|jgi:beta-lactamase class D
MKLKLLLLLFIPLSFSFTSSKVITVLRPDFESAFKEYNVEGSFLAYDLQAKTRYVYNPKRCKERFSPASTFKIFNSLVAIETGVAPDANYELKWDSIDRHNANWNRNTDMKAAFANSTVWYYQQLAKSIGPARMKEWIEKVGYGNNDISGGIDEFWLTGNLRISQEEQVEFLRKLYLGELPFSKRTMDMVKEIMVNEQTDSYKLSGKTGWAIRDEFNIIWFVGFLERNDKVYLYATNFETVYEDLPTITKGRIEITKSIFRKMNVIPKN